MNVVALYATTTKNRQNIKQRFFIHYIKKSKYKGFCYNFNKVWTIQVFSGFFKIMKILDKLLKHT